MADPKTPAATALPEKSVVSLTRFLKSVEKTEDEVWGRLLRVEAKTKVMTVEAWRALIAEIGARPAHPADPMFKRDATKAPVAPANPRKRK